MRLGYWELENRPPEKDANANPPVVKPFGDLNNDATFQESMKLLKYAG